MKSLGGSGIVRGVFEAGTTSRGGSAAAGEETPRSVQLSTCASSQARMAKGHFGSAPHRSDIMPVLHRPGDLRSASTSVRRFNWQRTTLTRVAAADHRATTDLDAARCALYVRAPHMPLLRSVANVGHALGWTAFMSSIGVATYTVTGNRPMFRRMTRFWAEGLARGWGMNVHAEGNHHLDPNGTYVFMANHLSHVDIVAL